MSAIIAYGYMPDSNQQNPQPASPKSFKKGMLLFACYFVALFVLFIFTRRGASNLLVFGFIALIAIALAYVSRLIIGDSSSSSSQSSASKNQVSSLFGSSKNGQIGLLEAVSDGIVTIDTKGIIQMLNSAAGYIAGWEQKDALNIDYRSVFKLCDTRGNPYDEEIDPFLRVLKSGKSIRDNNATIITQGSNKRISLSVNVSPIVDKNGNVSGAVAILRDVSEEREQERQRGEFISTASHEMRTPVAAIEGYLALAMNDKVTNIDGKAREYLTKAHDSTQHLGKLFQDLLTSSKAEDGRLSNHPEIIELSSFLSHLSEDLRFSAQKKNLSIEFVVGISGANVNASSELGGSTRVVQPLYNVYVDPERLREVVWNLFDNAVKYTDNGKVSIGLTGDDDIVQIYVKDSGKGIPTEDIPHLFQKFYRVDSSTTRTIGGTGLGLFICRKIIEMYNGRIWAESEPGKGSTFFINLPRLSNQRFAELNGTSDTTVITKTPTQ